MAKFTIEKVHTYRPRLPHPLSRQSALLCLRLLCLLQTRRLEPHNPIFEAEDTMADVLPITGHCTTHQEDI